MNTYELIIINFDPNSAAALMQIIGADIWQQLHHQMNGITLAFNGNRIFIGLVAMMSMQKVIGNGTMVSHGLLNFGMTQILAIVGIENYLMILNNGWNDTSERHRKFLFFIIYFLNLKINN